MGDWFSGMGDSVSNWWSPEIGSDDEFNNWNPNTQEMSAGGGIDRWGGFSSNYDDQNGIMNGMLAGNQQPQQQQAQMQPVSDPTSSMGLLASLKNVNQQAPDPFRTWTSPFVEQANNSYGGFR